MRVLNQVTGTIPTGGAAPYFCQSIFILIDLVGVLPVLVKATRTALSTDTAVIMSR